MRGMWEGREFAESKTMGLRRAVSSEQSVQVGKKGKTAAVMEKQSVNRLSK